MPGTHDPIALNTITIQTATRTFYDVDWTRNELREHARHTTGAKLRQHANLGAALLRHRRSISVEGRVEHLGERAAEKQVEHRVVERERHARVTT